MGFLDKVKEQAEKAKVQAQDLTGKVGDKVGEVQAKRKADDLLEDLGRLLYAQRTGRALPNAETELLRLVAELKALEDEGVPVLPPPPVAGAAPVVATDTAPAAEGPSESPAPPVSEAPATPEASS